jgi:hypothetical protein
MRSGTLLLTDATFRPVLGIKTKPGDNTLECEELPVGMINRPWHSDTL